MRVSDRPGEAGVGSRGRAGAPFLPFVPPESHCPGPRQLGLAQVTVGLGLVRSAQPVP